MSKSTEFSDSGNPIYRYGDRQQEWRPAEYGEEEWIVKIEDHVSQHIGKIDSVFHEILSDVVHIDVHIIKPTHRSSLFGRNGLQVKARQRPAAG